MSASFSVDTKVDMSQVGSVCVLGLGKSGKSAVRYFADRLGSGIDTLFIAAGAETSDSCAFLESIAAPGISWAFGDNAFYDAPEKFNLCVTSPGIPYWNPLYEEGERRSTEIISEVCLAWRISRKESIWIAVTGTNGKTTTTDLCAHILQQAGMRARAVGNIGDVALDAVLAGNTDVYVAEVSSYQLASCPRFSPDVAVILGITPDHIHWHKTLEAYAQAKFRLLDNLKKRATEQGKPCGVAILDALNDVVRSRVRELRMLSTEERGFAYIPVGTADGIHSDMRRKCGADNAAFVNEAGNLCVAFEGSEHVLLRSDELPMPGDHNVLNALMAASAAIVVGAPDTAVCQGIASFALLPHRLEACGVGTEKNLEFVNDSKGTNVDATCKALEAYPGRSMVVLLGGDDKDTELDELVKSVVTHAHTAVCYGQAGPRFIRAFEAASTPDTFTFLNAEHMEDALDRSIAAAHQNDIILLSPACASFDEFTSFEQRGDVFKSLVATRIGS